MNIKISNEEYSNACAEVLEILKSVKDEDLKRIPSEEIKNLKENANMEHEFSYDVTKNIKEQDISKAAKGIIAYFFVIIFCNDYFLSSQHLLVLLHHLIFSYLKY